MLISNKKSFVNSQNMILLLIIVSLGISVEHSTTMYRLQSLVCMFSVSVHVQNSINFRNHRPIIISLEISDHMTRQCVADVKGRGHSGLFQLKTCVKSIACESK